MPVKKRKTTGSSKGKKAKNNAITLKIGDCYVVTAERIISYWGTVAYRGDEIEIQQSASGVESEGKAYGYVFRAGKKVSDFIISDVSHFLQCAEKKKPTSETEREEPSIEGSKPLTRSEKEKLAEEYEAIRFVGTCKISICLPNGKFSQMRTDWAQDRLNELMPRRREEIEALVGRDFLDEKKVQKHIDDTQHEIANLHQRINRAYGISLVIGVVGAICFLVLR